MILSFPIRQLWETLLQRWPLLLFVSTWTALITVTVAVVSFSPEIAFTWAVSPPSSFALACKAGFVRLPLDGSPGEVVCMPAQLFGWSKLDLFVPPVFAAVVVVGSVCFVRAIGLWEAEEETSS